ncbi:bifunctional ADP-dependent NAD(P)H-hydrate dehydratase/NAD(P)H-hydrate epimerase [Streptomyces olivochromogenes]|uniref:Bifunctional NAD(P)H-hydrate repair enzyme n=1 Tax=Streptomyces olivochromogenes TaxID=1963 RepID=A0A250VE21_STROL|nr:bifunctional ADP-dependent NAD(P)H-hydrate dehydratase/NAD(P)H-hydrate epimerase [Streptomyces olivochromogenes]KUN47201.1 bifunctional ADP-dependent (S)-NAD(P)H-hydrate dehydratase/NAD(P)H-hydrate epimerase [Streptomyces olivochromogenes]GAX52286.1 bifunctional NAD(P)H-hydrate repair enzyme [Streptomyces olivochromogenes]
MRTAYSVETVRAAERELMARLAEGALMQRAAAGLAAACADLLGRVYGSRVVLLVGSGDNGGDALYAGARLARRGAGVTAVLLAPERTHGAGLAALRGAGGTVAGSGAAEELILRADLVVDGIVGIGGKGGLRPEAVPLAGYAADSRAAVVAVDLPSGIEADTGEVLGTAVRADLTVTFGTHKPGLLIDPGREYAGSVRLVDIGLELPEEAELEALQHADVAVRLPVPGAESDKYRRGVVGIAAGSARYPGAAVLAVSGALRGGAGAVRYVGPAADAVISRFPETLVSDQGPARAGRVQAWVVGPGVGDDASAVAQVLEADVSVLVDADGLRLADRSAVRARTAPTLMTPHAGEAAALLGVSRESVEAARLASARELALRYGATVLLKGSTTLVADPQGGAVRVNPTGTAWLATAGSGDVLSGLAGSLLAAGLSALDAGSVGAYLHGLAGRLAADGAPLGAHDVAAAIPEAWRDIRDALR